MVVRCVRSIMLLWVLVFGTIGWWFLSNADDQSIYSDHYHGPGAIIILLIKATHSAEILGRNPVMLAMGLWALAVVACFVRGLVAGTVARVEGNNVQFSGWFGGGEVVAIADISQAMCKSKVFGWWTEIILFTKDGRRKVISGANSADAAKLVETIRLNRPASPTSLPAT